MHPIRTHSCVIMHYLNRFNPNAHYELTSLLYSSDQCPARCNAKVPNKHAFKSVLSKIRLCIFRSLSPQSKALDVDSTQDLTGVHNTTLIEEFFDTLHDVYTLLALRVG